MKELIKMYNQGNGLVGILVDQNVAPKDGVVVKFFNKDATHTTIASVLSRRYNIDIQPYSLILMTIIRITQRPITQYAL